MTVLQKTAHPTDKQINCTFTYECLGTNPGGFISLSCVLEQDTLLSYFLSPRRPEYKWVPANCWGNLTECWISITFRGSSSILATSCYGIRSKTAEAISHLDLK